MKRLNIKIDGDVEEGFRADMERSLRGPQAEADYLFRRGLEAVKAELAVLKGKSQLDIDALRPESVAQR